MTENKKKHMHTVQKEYLKGFSTRENNRHFIWRFDKISEEVKKLQIKVVAVENYFYSQEIEDWLSEEIEGPGIELLKRVIENKSVLFLSKSDKIKIAKWIIVQDLRTTEYREQIKQLLKIRSSITPNEINKDKEEEICQDIQSFMIWRFEKYAPIIAMYIGVYV